MIPDRRTGWQGTQEERRCTEHIDISGHLNVPLADSFEKAPEREGWKPFFVNIDLSHPTVQKVVKYKEAA